MALSNSFKLKHTRQSTIRTARSDKATIEATGCVLQKEIQRGEIKIHIDAELPDSNNLPALAASLWSQLHDGI